MMDFTEEQIAWFGLTFGVTAFMLYMVFIIFQLARESKAGKFGTFVLFLARGWGCRSARARARARWWGVVPGWRRARRRCVRCTRPALYSTAPRARVGRVACPKA